MGSFHGDLLYHLLGAGIVLIVGFALIMKAGNKLGWVLVAGAVGYSLYALQPTMRKAESTASAPGSNGTSGSYYNLNKK